ncbi:uncharacterized protein LOC108024910 isoform X11 [Drosophila biarmipes]|uniref:uncharacterized protein LOC108024910 isoform X11 n=1 Tax=Drosophila biarmipes TaxID=125945 RepID=UPI0021CC706A|nr:uncharacterized protein LOC108024910 isoform X11 [Drosophila biarmipes]
MDPASNIVENVVEPKNDSAGVIQMAPENIDHSIENQSTTSTDDKDDADLIIDDSESDEYSSDSKKTADVAETEDLIKVTETAKTSLLSDADGTVEINENTEMKSEDPIIEALSIKSDQETSVSANTKVDKSSTVSEENPKVDVIDANTISVILPNASKANVPQDTSTIIIEDDEVKRTEEVVFKKRTQSLTEREADEPKTCELAAENSKNEVASSIENVNEFKEVGKNAVEDKDLNVFNETQQGKEAEQVTNQSDLLNDDTTERDLRLSSQADFNNQILDIISDIDINIKAQEKITQLKEQELKLIQKQNELANQIHQQQILAQQLNAKNTNKQSQCQQQNARDVLTLHQNNFVVKESTNISKNIDLRKIFTPATDATEILPKNRKLYASSAFYSPTLHPTVEDQVELARRISHSLSDISNQTSKGQSMYVNRKKRSDKWVHEGRSQDYQQYQQKPATSPNILPAYSDAGKHRVQLNIHQNQLIEKYSKPGLQVVQSPWDAALQTGSASTAFLEDKDSKSQCLSPAAVSPTPYFQSGRRDITDTVEPTHYSPLKDYKNANASTPQSINVPSNPQRDLAYTPAVAQGWGGRNVKLPKESLQYSITESSPQTRLQFYLNNDNLTSNFAIDVQSRLYELEKFQKLFLEHQPLEIEVLRNRDRAQAHNSCKDVMLKFEVELCDNDKQVKDVLDEKLNVRELIQSFEQQNISELSHSQNGLAAPIKYDNKGKGLYVPKEISLSSYAAPPQQYAGHDAHFESPNNGSASRPLSRTNFSTYQSSVGNNGTGQFPISKAFSPELGTVPPRQQLYAPSSYQRIPAFENVAPQVNFNPAPLTFDKMARYEQPNRNNSTSASSQYLNVKQNSRVRNVSPTPFGIVRNEHTSGSSFSTGSIGSPNRCGPLPGRPTSPLSNKVPIFNQCARGWGSISDKQQTYQSPFSSPQTGNLPYTDF